MELRMSTLILTRLSLVLTVLVKLSLTQGLPSVFELEMQDLTPEERSRWCPYDGYFPLADPAFCDYFYRCVYIGQDFRRIFFFRCPQPLVFNSVVSVCDWPDNVDRHCLSFKRRRRFHFASTYSNEQNSIPQQ